jgi:type II secretion system protein H
MDRASVGASGLPHRRLAARAVRVRRFEARAGFTLVEIALVVTIIGIVLAAAVPSFTRHNAWARIEGDARELSSQMQLARQAAVTRRVPYRLTIDRSESTYTVERQENDSTWVRVPDRVFHLDGVSAMELNVGDGSSYDQIHFETRGTVATADSPTEVRLISSQADTAVVSLVRTGRVTVHMKANSE